ncbi:hypothetical protein [Pseudobacteriovorax antillogorgiicola]|uniref:Uncharacterized protein n=1 Tax=Pseudobacteriovorax antillogorgiicola TaxID=1513793 RepID=A0A1Y6BS04_9BACT|nr:hypothetical protein [Pseudobacteriovorax antillogorgiicola]TCS53059.1 hypothetical protein EDD56_108110 [Pseudobacteriovorax antillogorgiicola]SMF26337.1 hypothetical protein SAMN06296036_108137 [Pseudobacteriovorax antillogorgiicola]
MKANTPYFNAKVFLEFLCFFVMAFSCYIAAQSSALAKKSGGMEESRTFIEKKRGPQ